jgi:hypothetical protein
VPVLAPQVAQVPRPERPYLQLLHSHCGQLVIKGDEQSVQMRSTETEKRWLIRISVLQARWPSGLRHSFRMQISIVVL